MHVSHNGIVTSVLGNTESLARYIESRGHLLPWFN